MPDFALERELRATLGSRDGGAIVIGLDEAGRGPWAGPVLAAAVWLDPGRSPKAALDRLDDSKALAPVVREELYEAILDCARAGFAAVGVGLATVVEIDEVNILRASLNAMARAAAQLTEGAGLAPDAALIDGTQVPDLPCPARAVVKGDRRSLSIAAASVVAKVARDRIMTDLARRHPGYGWERNRGYGTPEHRAALRRLGVSPEHRRSFRPVREALGGGPL
ncbi:MAG: ribonuclease HII [Kiloniellaceae bacterium]